MSLLLKLAGAVTQPVIVHTYQQRGSVAVTSWVPVTQIEVQGALTGYVQRGTVQANSWGFVVSTGGAPTDTSITPNQGSVAISGYAPIVARTSNVSLVPSVGSVSLTGYVPTVAQTVTAGPIGVVHYYVQRGTTSVVSWMSDGVSPNPSPSITPTYGNITITGYAPSVVSASGYTLTPGGTVTLSGTATFLRTHSVVPTGAITFSGTSAQLKNKIVIPTGLVTFSGSNITTRTKVFTVSGNVSFSGSAGFIGPTGTPILPSTWRTLTGLGT